MNQPAQPSPEALLRHLHQLERETPDAPGLDFALAAVYQGLKQLERAAEYYRRGLQLEPDVWEAHFGLAGIAAIGHDFATASGHYQRCLAIDPLRPQAWFGLANLYTRLRDWPRLEACYGELLARFPALQAQPSIFLNTLPRSASIYLTTTLRLMLGREFLMVAEIESANEELLAPSARLFARGGVITQAHLPATPANLELMNASLDRLVVQIRDPRQAVLSLVHLLRRRQGSKLAGSLPPDYHQRELAGQLAWSLEHHYPELLTWIMGWLRVREQGLFRGELLLTRYEDFLADQPGFYARLLRFHGLDPAAVRLPDGPPPEGYLNFRKGHSDEWRELFSPAQAARAWELMPQELRGIYRP